MHLKLDIKYKETLTNLGTPFKQYKRELYVDFNDIKKDYDSLKQTLNIDKFIKPTNFVYRIDFENIVYVG